MSNISPPGSDANQSPRQRRRLWLWFSTGFIVVFLALAIAYPMHFYDGGSVRQTRLWQYYLLEIQLAMNSSGNLGPTSDNLAAALITAMMHVVVSSVVGTVMLGIGWMSQLRHPVK